MPTRTILLAIALFAPRMLRAKDPDGGRALARPRPRRSTTTGRADVGGATESSRSSSPRRERYVLALVNRDRAEQKLPPVVWDETAAQGRRRPRRRHGARHGFTAHVGSDGSVPEARYTDAGGDTGW